MSEPVPGRFITFEGGEGTGKSTQAALLADWLRGRGIEALATREPGGAEGAELIRRLLVEGDTGRWSPMTEALLHFAARKENLDHTIMPALAAGHWVICDRFADSTMAYQGQAQGLGREIVSGLCDIVLGDFRPDLTLILDMPAEVGLARARERLQLSLAEWTSEDRYERMGGDFHDRLRTAFLEIAEREPARCVVIDATRDVGAVAGSIWECVAHRFALGT